MNIKCSKCKNSFEPLQDETIFPFCMNSTTKHKLKSAGEWLNSWDKRNTTHKDWHEHIVIIEQIQQNAIREGEIRGMRKAAEIISNPPNVPNNGTQKVEYAKAVLRNAYKAILSEVSKLEGGE